MKDMANFQKKTTKESGTEKYVGKGKTKESAPVDKSSKAKALKKSCM